MIKLEDAKDRVRAAVERKVISAIHCAAGNGEESTEVIFSTDNWYIQNVIRKLKADGYGVVSTSVPEGLCLKINWI
jgi:hypothetical protein